MIPDDITRTYEIHFLSIFTFFISALNYLTAIFKEGNSSVENIFGMAFMIITVLLHLVAIAWYRKFRSKGKGGSFLLTLLVLITFSIMVYYYAEPSWDLEADKKELIQYQSIFGLVF